MWSKALQVIDRNIDWLSEDAWVIVQIHPVEYESTDQAKLIAKAFG